MQYVDSGGHSTAANAAILWGTRGFPLPLHLVASAGHAAVSGAKECSFEVAANGTPLPESQTLLAVKTVEQMTTTTTSKTKKMTP